MRQIKCTYSLVFKFSGIVLTRFWSNIVEEIRNFFSYFSLNIFLMYPNWKLSLRSATFSKQRTDLTRLSLFRTDCSSSWSTWTEATWCFRFSARGSSMRRDLVFTRPRSRPLWCSCTGTESYTGNHTNSITREHIMHFGLSGLLHYYFF